MKKIIIGLLALSASTVHAAGKCEWLAARVAATKFKNEFKVKNQQIRTVEFVECKMKVSKKGNAYRDCEVTAGGNNAGDITFGILLNAACTDSFSQYIKYEE